MSVSQSRETLVCGADKTLVCSEPVRPVHPSRAPLACERDVNWTMSMLYESERARWEMGRASILIHRHEANHGRLSTRVKTTHGT